MNFIEKDYIGMVDHALAAKVQKQEGPIIRDYIGLGDYALSMFSSIRIPLPWIQGLQLPC